MYTKTFASTFAHTTNTYVIKDVGCVEEYRGLHDIRTNVFVMRLKVYLFVSVIELGIALRMRLYSTYMKLQFTEIYKIQTKLVIM